MVDTPADERLGMGVVKRCIADRLNLPLSSTIELEQQEGGLVVATLKSERNPMTLQNAGLHVAAENNVFFQTEVDKENEKKKAARKSMSPEKKAAAEAEDEKKEKFFSLTIDDTTALGEGAFGAVYRGTAKIGMREIKVCVPSTSQCMTEKLCRQ